MNLTEKHALELSDLTAFGEWEDGEGAECATTSGVWFAALAYERARVAKLENKLRDQLIVCAVALEKHAADASSMQWNLTAGVMLQEAREARECVGLSMI